MQIYNSLILVAQSRELPNVPKKYLRMTCVTGNASSGNQLHLESQLEAVTDRSARTPLEVIGLDFAHPKDSLKTLVNKEFAVFNEKGGREAAQPKCDEMIQAIDMIIGSAKKHSENLCFKIKTFLAAYLPWLFQSPEKILNGYINHLEAIKEPIINACAKVLTIEEINQQVNQKIKAEYIEKIQKEIVQLQSKIALYTDENRALQFAEKCKKAIAIENQLIKATNLKVPLKYVVENVVFKKILLEIEDLKIGHISVSLTNDKQKLLDKYINCGGIKELNVLALITKLLEFTSDLKAQEMKHKASFDNIKLELQNKISLLQEHLISVEKLDVNNFALSLEVFGPHLGFPKY